MGQNGNCLVIVGIGPGFVVSGYCRVKDLLSRDCLSRDCMSRDCLSRVCLCRCIQINCLFYQFYVGCHRKSPHSFFRICRKNKTIFQTKAMQTGAYVMVDL
jgi:hypothetical protein